MWMWRNKARDRMLNGVQHETRGVVRDVTTLPSAFDSAQGNDRRDHSAGGKRHGVGRGTSGKAIAHGSHYRSEARGISRLNPISWRGEGAEVGHDQRAGGGGRPADRQSLSR